MCEAPLTSFAQSSQVQALGELLGGGYGGSEGRLEEDVASVTAFAVESALRLSRGGRLYWLPRCCCGICRLVAASEESGWFCK